MMLLKDTTEQNMKNSTEKLGYLSPVLVDYGKVAELTRSGPGSVAETLFKPACVDATEMSQPCF
jgi:hypothetical protein